MNKLGRVIIKTIIALPIVGMANPYYPGKTPGKASAMIKKTCRLSNNLISAEWSSVNGLQLSSFTNVLDAKMVKVERPAFSVTIDQETILSTAMVMESTPQITILKAQKDSPTLSQQFAGKAITCKLKDKAGRFIITWSAILRNGSSYIRQQVSVKSLKAFHLAKVTLLDTSMDGAKVVGSVLGSPIVTDTIFVAFEHPMSANSIGDGGTNSYGTITVKKGGVLIAAKSSHITCSFDRNSNMKPGAEFICSSVIGVFPKGQLRRGFLYYMERERAHSYRQYLHYNSWYDLNISRPKNRMSEAEALNSINAIGTELVTKRGVDMDGFVMDDGWDSHESVWEFHNKFPHGFTNIGKAAGAYGAGVGVWMSPWGGYGGEKASRMRSGKKLGLETNRSGFSMSGKQYGAHFKNTCFKMMKDYGVNHFKFDGMGGGNFTAGASAELADDINAILDMSLALRAYNQNVWINATVGTWPSPFWTRYADSIWRQGEDTGFAGVGNKREQWITYRDKLTYERIVKRGPLYPLNSLMFHGTVIGERHHPKAMPLNEKSVRHEVRAAFGCGSGLQELYITPKLLTKQMWDDIAESAKWSRKQQDIFYDTHWIGGIPGKLQVYGWASWIPGKGIITLRNPSDKVQEFKFTLKKVLELPNGVTGDYILKSPYTDQRLQKIETKTTKLNTITLKPFEVLIFEVSK